MAAPRKFSDNTIEQMLQAFHSDMNGEAVAKSFGTSYFPTLRRLWRKHYGDDALKARHARLSALGKVGSLNPMKGKFGPKHHRYVGDTISSMGYRLVPAPRWYAGPRDKGSRAAEHVLVACLKARIRRLPPCHIVHHKDENKLNNHPDNLEIMTRGRHAAIHRWLDHYRKEQRLSRKGVRSKKGGKAPNP